MLKYLDKYARGYEKCQKFVPIHHVPSNELASFSSPWLFIQWGLDIVRPLPTALGWWKFILVVTNYFLKWVEPEAYFNVKDMDVVNFVCNNIICRFWFPRVIISDNGSQFISTKFRNFCSKFLYTS